MSDMDPFAGRKEAGKKKWAGKAVEKEARTKAQMDAAAAERAAADAAAKERAREARQARSRMETEEHRRRQEQFREETKKMHETPGGATTYYRLQHLEVLGLRAEQDNLADIRRAHKRLALRYHPDKNTSGDAPAMFRRIQAAYEALTKKE